MGILKAHLKILSLLKQDNENIFKGNLLTISQQAVYATNEEVIKILKENNIKISPLPDNMSTSNKIVDWEKTKYSNNTNANVVFSYLGAKSVKCCDVTNYENPDFILDLNVPVENNLLNQFDTLVDIGTLEHVFDVKTAVSNYIAMLKINGYIIISVPSSNMIDHGFYSFSPTLFYDFFLLNGFEIQRCFLRESSPFIYENKSKIYEYKGYTSEIPFISSKSTEFTFVAKKIETVKSIQIPNQSVYSKNTNWSKGRGLNDKINNNFQLKIFLKKIIKAILLNKFVPFFIHKHIFLFFKNKKIRKIYGKY